MLDIETLLSYPVVTRGLVADLPLLREPCTCGAGLPKCPACVAWDERYLCTADEREEAETRRFVPPADQPLSAEDLAALRRQITTDAAVVRMLEKRQRRHGQLAEEDQATLASVSAYLTTNRRLRDAAINASKKGHFYGKRVAR